MGNLKFFESIINKNMLDLHTAFLGEVLSVSNGSAKVQPLGLTKETGGTAKTYAPISSVPITNQARYKFKVKGEEVKAESIENGDIVICVCCDRDITEARKGKSVLPPSGHHTMSDCVIVGIL